VLARVALRTGGYPIANARGFSSGLAEVRAARIRAGRPTDAVSPALFVTVLVTDARMVGGQNSTISRIEHTDSRSKHRADPDVRCGTPDVVAARLLPVRRRRRPHLVCRIGVLGPDPFLASSNGCDSSRNLTS